MKFEKLSYKTLFTIFFFAVAGIIFFLKIGNKNITKVSATWWNSSWNYRKSISITNTSGVGQSNVLVKIFENYNLSGLVSEGKLQSDIDDIRFTDSNDNAINYWVEDTTNNSADVWVKIPSFPTSGATIWFYYGNPSATSGSTAFYNYTGTSEFISDSGGQFRIKLKTDGVLTLSANMIVDTFLVGGGAGSIATANGGGAGGGYTTNGTDNSLSIGTSYSTTIGVGGTAGARGGTTQFNSLSAAGGYTNSGSNGGNGGSGGGFGGPWYAAGGYYCCAGNGASNGAGAGGNCASGGSGQGTTTREFGGASTDLYAGGGGGYGGYNSACGTNWMAGGAGGGGAAGSPGTANTGGGAGANGYSGGSGIVVIRYNSPATPTVDIHEENNLNLDITWWNTSWRYRQTINITNSCGAEKTNFLVKVFENYNLSGLVSNSKLKSDLSDIRFTDASNNTLNYWIEDSTNTSADIWVILASLPTSGTSIYMYYGNSSATTASTAFYNYNSSSTFISDGGGQFRIKFTSGSSNVFTSSANMSVDVFLVGGGGSGGSSSTNWNGGGGGGYTTTSLNYSISANVNQTVTVGSGGAAGASNRGGTSYFNALSAAGGYGNNGENGGAGGSGGGCGGTSTWSCGAGNGGTNGGNGGSNCASGGSGQGTTTREFGGTTGDPYSGGGGGHGYAWNGTGGLWGGGNAFAAGVANSGGGGGARAAGGSGVVIIRYNASCAIASINPATEEDYANPPMASVCLIEESQSDNQLNITWHDNSSYETGFYLQKSTNSGTWTDNYTSGSNITSHVDTDISANNTYQYRVASYTSATTSYNWCYTSTLNLGQGNFNFEGLNLEGVNLD